MKLLCFQAKRFRWKSYLKTLANAPDREVEEEVLEALVVFVHVESSDETVDARSSLFRQTLKHIKWLANKRKLKNIVLHSFSHLSGQTASPPYALSFLTDLVYRLQNTGYQVWTTPFGYFCEWDLSVHGDSLAKVWKELRE